MPLPEVPHADYFALTEEQRHGCRRTVAVWAKRNNMNPAEAIETMLMLGVYPGQDVADFVTPNINGGVWE
jgi:uncharacterized protein YeaC (DUF1315 family)